MEKDKKPLRPKLPIKGKGPFKFKFNFFWIYLAIGLFFMGSMFMEPGQSSKEVSYSKLEQAMRQGYVVSMNVTLNKNIADAEIVSSSAKEIMGAELDKDVKKNPHINALVPSIDEFSKLISELQQKGVLQAEVKYEEGRDYTEIFMSVIPLLLMVAFFIWLMRRSAGSGGPGGVLNVGKNKAKLFDKNQKDGKVTFNDVAGLSGAKQEVEEIVSFLRKPDKYTELGGKIPKGALLVGPPGTGKTLLAKAVAGEAEVPFFSMSGSDFVEMFVGVGASRVRDLFREAKEKAPCIVFIDEIDAVGRARSKNAGMSSNDERENTLNQLLTEMDGFGSNSGVIILAATNRADILDKALLRAGRFDRQIHVDLPDVHERKAIFKVHMRPLKLDSSVDLELMSRQTPGFCGADIANVCNEAALIAARKDKQSIGQQDFLDAVDRIVGGLEKKTKIVTEDEKKSIAYHEAGHATVSWKLEHANPLIKVTIVPRGQALGAAWYLPEERQLTTKEHILDEMCALLGGRAAEEVYFHTRSTGAMNDLERATKQAYAMVAYYGMSEKLSNISYYDSTGNSDYGFTKPYSDSTAELIDLEAKRIVSEQFERAKKILMDNTEGHNAIAEKLIEREVIFTDDVKSILGERPWTSRTQELFEANEKVEKEQKAKEEETATKEAVKGIVEQLAQVSEKKLVESEENKESEEETPKAEK